uniref:Uncharacterized protein n=1 Tax=Meloidogyne enterolobii TaxID=390850 RepID=A0A6V7TVS7_MELEN|nr:unnamed protein product [Meloidogyne enterolobii]
MQSTNNTLEIKNNKNNNCLDNEQIFVNNEIGLSTNLISSNNMAISIHPKKNSNEDIIPSSTYRWFLSYRMMTASMLCLCFARQI